MERITEIDDESILSSTATDTEAQRVVETNDAVDEKQNRVVNHVRYAVFGILLMVTMAVSLSVYFYIKKEEETAFEDHFMDQATKVAKSFTFNAEKRLEALTAFSQQITSFALHSNLTFPFVTLPDFERHATSTLKLAEIVALLVFPIVTADQRFEWTAYATANQGWIEEGLQLQQQRVEEDKGEVAHLQEQFDKGQLVIETDGVDTTKQVPPFIFKVKPGTTEAAFEDGPGPYAPVWTFAPTIPAWNLVNFNSFSHPTRARELVAFMQTQQTLLSSAADFRMNDPLTANRKSVMNLFLNRWQNGTFEYEAGPVSDIYIPIFDKFGPDRKLGQVMAAYIYWQSYFTNVLAQGQNGIVCVLENTCGQSFTYELHGPRAHYIGQGDLHEKKYDGLVVETGFGAFLGKDVVAREPLEAECFYNVRVYPSTEMESDHMTSAPLIFALGLMGVFLFTSAVFLTYDRLVSKRYSIVETKAIQSTAVVQALFPERVRDRIYDSNNDGKPKESRGFLRKHRALSFTDDTQNMVDESMPIADLYPGRLTNISPC